MKTKYIYSNEKKNGNLTGNTNAVRKRKLKQRGTQMLFELKLFFAQCAAGGGKSGVANWPALTTVTAALSPAVAAQRARRSLRNRWTFRGVRDVPAWGAGGSREGGGRGFRARAVSGHQPHCSTSRAKERHRGPAVATGVAGDAAPPTQGLGPGKSCCLGAASIRVVFSPLLVVHPVTNVFGHVRCWSSGWSGVLDCGVAVGRGFLGLLVGASGWRGWSGGGRLGCRAGVRTVHSGEGDVHVVYHRPLQVQRMVHGVGCAGRRRYLWADGRRR
jgi:hypothetical protein